MEENVYNQEEANHSADAPLVVDSHIQYFLSQTIRWGRFLAILGFVGAALIGVVGILVLVLGSTLNSVMPDEMGSFSGLMALFYILMSALYYFPSKYLYDFCRSTKRAFALNDQETLVFAFSKLKSVFKFWGIFALVMLILYGFILAFAILAGIVAAV